MEYSSTRSNRSLRSLNIDDVASSRQQDNSIIIEEREHDESTKYSDPKKNIVLPAINHKTPTIKGGKNLEKLQPTYYYSLHFERSKLGTISTRVIKEQGKLIKERCKSISLASQKYERGATENSSTTDTLKNDNYISKVTKGKQQINTNHRYNNTRISKAKLLPVKTQNMRKTKRKTKQ